MSDSVRPQRRQPTRLPHPWDSPDKNTGVGCHFLLQCMQFAAAAAKLLQSCLTLCDPIDGSSPGSPVPGILQIFNIMYETSCQSRFDARYWMLGAGALGRHRGMEWGGRREEGSGWGTHVYLWRIHFDIWQN